MMIDPDRLADQLVSGTVDAATFGHTEHVAAAYALLRKHPFEQAAQRYASAIRTLATDAGAPAKFHMTITLAFLSLIAERLAATDTTTFTDFAAAQPDLMDVSCLGQWYSQARLGSDVARHTFVLPDRIATA